jgi:phage terminase small subunit
METSKADLARVLTPVAPDDDTHLIAVGDLTTLTLKQEAFARALAETGNAAAAYRMTYSVRERTLPQSVWAQASKLACMPQVRARVRQFQDDALLETILTVQQAFQYCVDVATADPNDIVRVVHRCCRYCHGHDYGYQWKDDLEYIAACAKACEEKDALMPSDSGGYGFNGALEPNPICPHCYGVGHEQTIVADTTKLEGKARRLYAGAKQDRFGAIEVKLHDQKAYMEMACRMLGAFNDKLDLRTPEQRAAAEAKTKLPANVTEEQAQRAYLDLIQGAS